MEVSGHLHDSSALPPGKEPLGTHWMEGLMGSKAGLDAVKKRNISCPIGNRTLAVQPVALRYIDWATNNTNTRYWKVHNKICPSKPSYLFLKLYFRSSDGTNKVDHLNIDHGGERDWQLFLLLTHKRGHSVHGSPLPPAPSSLQWTRTVNYQPSHCWST
jgi:hypothetical protein